MSDWSDGSSGFDDLLSFNEIPFGELVEKPDNVSYCHVCRKFVEVGIQKHKREVHAEYQQLYECPEKNCTYSSEYRHRIRIHVASVHEKKREFVCSFCPFSASQRSDITRHEARHVPAKFKCSKCDKRYKRKESLWVHLKQCDKKAYSKKFPFACVFCPKRYRFERFLNRHTANEHKTI